MSDGHQLHSLKSGFLPGLLLGSVPRRTLGVHAGAGEDRENSETSLRWGGLIKSGEQDLRPKLRGDRQVNKDLRIHMEGKAERLLGALKDSGRGKGRKTSGRLASPAALEVGRE